MIFSHALTWTMIWNRKVAIGVAVVLVLTLLVYGFWPSATPVTIEHATRDSLRVTIEEEGRTQLRNQYDVSAPTTAYLKRVPGEAGDRVEQGEILARLATLPSTVNDVSSYRAAQAQVQAAEAGLRRAEREAEAAQVTYEHANTEYQRIQRLHERGTASQQELDAARVEARQAEAQYEAAQQTVEQARHEVQVAQTRLAPTSTTPEGLDPRIEIPAPVEGRILQVHRKSAGVVQAGTPLITMGPPDSLQVAVDVLSSDAVRIAEGMPVEIIRWGGDRMLDGTVRVVPPQGETQVSALGVEEQRVEVVVNLHEEPPIEEPLGAGYRVVARFILWEGGDVLQVPQSALFQHEDGWAVFVVQDGYAQRRPVEVGRRSGLQIQITDGLQAGVPVVTHPGSELEDGMRVEAR